MQSPSGYTASDKTSFVLNKFSLSLSRACLGKYSVSSIKWRQQDVLSPAFPPVGAIATAGFDKDDTHYYYSWWKNDTKHLHILPNTVPIIQHVTSAFHKNISTKNGAAPHKNILSLALSYVQTLPAARSRLMPPQCMASSPLLSMQPSWSTLLLWPTLYSKVRKQKMARLFAQENGEEEKKRTYIGNIGYTWLCGAYHHVLPFFSGAILCYHAFHSRLCCMSFFWCWHSKATRIGWMIFIEAKA